MPKLTESKQLDWTAAFNTRLLIYEKLRRAGWLVIEQPDAGARQ